MDKEPRSFENVVRKKKSSKKPSLDVDFIGKYHVIEMKCYPRTWWKH